MIVVDSNVVAYLVLPGAFTSEAKALLAHDAHWAAPSLWRSEFRNIIAGFLRRKLLTFDQACALQREAEDLMAGAEFAVESTDVLRLVRESRCSAYDCEFVALAERLDVPLVTRDRQLLDAFPGRAVSLA